MQHIHLNIWQRHTALSLTWKDHVIRSHGVVALGLTYIPPSLLLMCRHAGGRHWPVALATSCALFCTDWLNRPGAGPVFAFLTGKSPLSSNKAWYKVQRMLVSSWCGVASSCGCSKGGNHHFDLLLSMFWSRLCWVLWEHWVQNSLSLRSV